MLAGRHADAVAEADALVRIQPQDASLAYDAACAYSLAISSDPLQTETRACRALALLERARELGLFSDTKQILHMRRDADLDSLRGRADFRAFVASVEPEALPVPRAAP